jgi:multicomponent Na+:H+ antiporter subunit F
MLIENFPILSVAIYISFGFLAISLFLGLYQMLVGKSVPDRIVVMDLIASLVIGLTITHVMLSGKIIFLFVAMVIALLVFMSNVAFAYYLNRRMEND